MDISINPELKSLIPPLSEDERNQLEQNLLENGCRDPLVVWDGVLLDGHNRYEICEQHDIAYETVNVELESIAEARVWMRNNQMGRRNLTPAWRIELALGNKEDLAKVAKQAQGRRSDLLSPSDKKSPDSEPSPEPIHNTRSEIAKSANTSTGMVGMAEVVRRESPEAWEKAKQGEVSVKSAYNTIKKKEDIQKRAEAVAAQTVEDARVTPCYIFHKDAQSWLDELDPIDLLLTDPPYSTDVEDIDGFVEWLPAALEKLKPTGRAFVFVGAYPKELQAYMRVAMPDQILVWTYRNTLGPSPKQEYKLNWQAILYYRKPESQNLDCPIMTEQFAVQDINAPDGRLGDRYHSWQKPIDIAERFIRHSTKAGDVVADPFACTGTFLLAASRLGRQGVGCEINPDHLGIAISRGCQRG